jgi:hypothetical protein
VVVVDKGGADVLAPVVVVVDKVGSDVVAPGVVLVPTGCVGAVSDARVLLVGGGDASGTAVAVTLAEGAGDDLSAVPSEDESPELHPVAPAIASAVAAATVIVLARAMLHPATEVPSRAFTRFHAAVRRSSGGW